MPASPGHSMLVVCHPPEWGVCLLPPDDFSGMLCSTTDVNNVSHNFLSLLHGGQQHPESSYQYSKSILDHPTSTGYPVVSYSLLSGQLSSAIWLDQPRVRAKESFPSRK